MAKPRSPRADIESRAQGAAEGAATPRPGVASPGVASPGGEMHGDAAMFRAAVGDVRPLTSTGRAIRPAASASTARRRAAVARRAQAEEALMLLPDTPAPQDVVGGPDPLSFRRPGVRDQEMRRLRRGLYGIEDDIDLHGLDRAAARDTLSEFLGYQRAAGRRCVRIVHGKGYRSGARGPILKMAVNAWLKQHPDVVAFTSARSIDGGTGAVYVLLRA